MKNNNKPETLLPDLEAALNKFWFERSDEDNAVITEAARAHLAAQQQSAGTWQVPDGWKLVPIEPTKEMIKQGEAAADETAHARLSGMHLAWRSSENPTIERYKAMVSYAPTPPSKDE